MYIESAVKRLFLPCLELRFYYRLCNPLYLPLFRSSPIPWLNGNDT